ncbi:MAG: MBL fold metallo-hydrolase [Armatimonadota bacterium]|nr:MBL fold metallo-hydrolase [Armatimonadota bacterium]
MIRLTVFGGAGEIGGNKILLEDAGTRLLLDFGISYTRRGLFFEEYLKPRTAAGLADLLVTGVLPEVSGIYRSDLLALGGPRTPAPHDRPAVDGLLLSHAHLDHAGHLGFLDERVPTYCSSLCHAMLVAMQGSRGRDFETEIVDFRPRPAFPDTRDVTIPRRFVRVDGAFQAGGLRCRALPVDHSMLGCVAFLIETSRGHVLYTGDLRFHGPDAALSEAMLADARAAGVWLLLTEGTRLDVVEERTETHVLDECLAAVRATRGPVIADFAPRDLYRLHTFLRIARETDRRLVILSQDAHLLNALLGMHPLVVDPRGEPFVILKERKQSGTYSERDYPRWERHVLAWPTARTAGDLRTARDRLILALSFWDIQNLVDLGVGEDALYIQSSSEAYTEEQALDARRLNNWLDMLGVRRRLQSHASGHAPRSDLARLVETVRPEVLVPIHTVVPRLWRDVAPTPVIIEPVAGRVIEL